MRRIILCLLFMGLLAGCTKQEVPNDQPIEENQENEQVVEQSGQTMTETVKKLDDTKDWVYIDEILTYDFEEDAYQSQAITYLNDHDLLTIEVPKINVDTDNIEKINQEIKEMLYDQLDIVSYYENSKVPMNNVSSRTRYVVSDNILSVIVRSLLIYGEYEIQISVYNIDLKTGELIGNEQLLSCYGMDYQSASIRSIEEIENMGISACDKQAIQRPCFYESTLKVDENSYLYVNDKNQLMQILFDAFAENTSQGYPYSETETEVVLGD